MLRVKLEFDELINEMLDKIPEDYWKSENATFLDPAAAGGQILTAIENRLRKYGHSDENISNRVSGYFKSKFYSEIAKNRNKLVSNRNVARFLEEPMKHFDVIIGNPPFQKNQKNPNAKGKGLWPKFWEKSLEHADKIILITPSTWISASGTKIRYKNKSQKLWDIFDQYSSYADVDNVQRHFPKIGSSFGYVYVDKSGSDGLKFSNPLPKIWQDVGFRPTYTTNMDEIAKNLCMENNLQSISEFSHTGRSRGKSRVVIQRNSSPNQIEQKSWIIDAERDYTERFDNDNYIFIHTDEPERVLNRLLEIKNIWTVQSTGLRWNGYISAPALKYIKL